MLANLSWNNSTLYFIIVIWILCVLVAILVLFQNKTKKSIFSLKKTLVYEIDKIFYDLAQFQEQNKWSDANLQLMESLFELQNPTYLWNIPLILSKIKDFQQNVASDIIPDKHIAIIQSKSKELKSKSITKKITDIILCILIVLILVVVFMSIK